MDWPGKLRITLPHSPQFDFVADYTWSGTVLYWLEPKSVIPVPIPRNVNERLVKPRDYVPQQRLVLQPAYIVDAATLQACGQVLVFIGGAIIAVTIIENFVTLGAGVFDDAITVPGGLLLINMGQRLAVYVPAES